MIRADYLEDDFDRRLVDSVLLLALWHFASSEKSDAGGRLRLMKLAYLLFRRLQCDSVCALSVNFYRWQYGPMSNEVYEAWERLEAADLMEEEEVWTLTDSGVRLAENFYEEVLKEESNAAVKAAVDEVAQEWRTAWSAQPLMQHIYSLSSRIAEVAPSIEDMALGDDFEPPPAPADAEMCLNVDDSWVESLSVALSSESMASLRSSVADFRGGRIHLAR